MCERETAKTATNKIEDGLRASIFEKKMKEKKKNNNT